MSRRTIEAADGRARALLAAYARAGFLHIEPPILQPVPTTDLGAERGDGRIALAGDADGSDLCLRPDFAIAVAHAYLQAGAGKVLNYCYLGPVFHRSNGVTFERLQAGIESFGRLDRAAADAEMLALGLEATTQYGISRPDIFIGDVGLFAAFVAALGLDAAWQWRLLKNFNNKSLLAQDLQWLAWVPTESPARPPADTQALIVRYLAIVGNPDDGAVALRALAADVDPSFGAALDLFETRTGFLAARGIDVRSIRFATAFQRGFDYDSGFVFELRDPRTNTLLVSGSRHDGLLTQLGAPEPIPAVGFAADVEELAGCAPMS